MLKSRVLSVFLVLILTLLLGGCAGTTAANRSEVPAMHSVDEFKDLQFAYVEDPWEGFNRSMYKFNFYIDKYLFLPVVSSYEFVTPVFVQNRVTDFFGNVGEVRNLTNSLFQLKGKESLTTLGRFVTNSTLGLGGLFDPATTFGLKQRNQDFGKTLGYWGAESGPFLVLPFFGPSSLRDASGFAVDSSIRYGIFYLGIDPFQGMDSELVIEAGITGLEGIDIRHQVSFRYFESGYPFEYNMTRFFYHEKRELEIPK